MLFSVVAWLKQHDLAQLVNAAAVQATGDGYSGGGIADLV